MKSKPSWSPVQYVKDSRAELARVTWPTRDRVIKMTMVVIGVSVVIGAYLAGLDYLFIRMVTLLVSN